MNTVKHTPFKCLPFEKVPKGMGFTCSVHNSKDEFITDAWGETIEEAQTLGKLIAAAPEYLETIQDILESFHHPDGSCVIAKDSIIHKRLISLNKKATE